VKWMLCGSRVCFSIFAHLLGTAPRTILKSIRGQIDGRQHRGLHPGSAAQSQAVDFFFYELHQSAHD